MATALRGGTQTYWRSWGTGLPDLLLMHCTMAHSGAWAPFIELLGRSAVGFDLPGHGRSGAWDKARDYQEQCVAMGASFLGSAPIDLIGHSFGATVALRMALENPGAVRRLVLIEPVLFAAAAGTGAYTRYGQVFQPILSAAEPAPEEAARLFTEIWGTGVPWQAMRDEQRHALAEQIHIIPAQQGAIIDDNAGVLVPDRLEALDLPVLIMEGGKSPEIIGAVNEVLAARLPHATRSIVAPAAHMLPLTHPRDAVAEIAPFLSS